MFHHPSARGQTTGGLFARLLADLVADTLRRSCTSLNPTVRCKWASRMAEIATRTEPFRQYMPQKQAKRKSPPGTVWDCPRVPGCPVVRNVTLAIPRQKGCSSQVALDTNKRQGRAKTLSPRPHASQFTTHSCGRLSLICKPSRPHCLIPLGTEKTLARLGSLKQVLCRLVLHSLTLLDSQHLQGTTDARVDGNRVCGYGMQYSMGTDLPLRVSGHAERMNHCLPGLFSALDS